MINNDIKNLTIKSYESLDGDVDQLSSALDVISNIKGKKVLYVSNSIKGNAEDYEKAGILAQSSVSIGTAIAKGLINFKKDTLVDKVSNMVDNSNGIIASYDVEDSINDEDIANLTEQGISRIIIKTSEENIETAENKKQMLSKKGGIVDVMIVVVNENGSYRIEGEKDTQIVDYTQAQNMSVSELKNSIVYVNDAKNLVLGEKDIEKLTGVALAFDADIINSMEAKDTEKDGISMLSIVKLLVKQNNPEAKRNKAIIKGRNIVIENKIGDFKVEDFIEGGKAVITDKQLKDLKIEARTSEEKEGIALGIIQTLELKKVYEVERLNINKERADAANELLTMLGEYRLLVKKSYADNNEDEITIEGSGSDYNEILSNLRDKLRSNESDKTATLEQIIKILLTDQLELEANIEELSDMDVRITQALLAAA